MRKFLLASAAAATLGLGLAASTVEASPIVGGPIVSQSLPSNVENVTFFRCGLFGQFCRHHYYRRGYGHRFYRGY